MIVLAIIVGYVLVGLVASRVVFIQGMRGERRFRGENGKRCDLCVPRSLAVNPNAKCLHTTEAYDACVIWATGALPFWPVYIVVTGIVLICSGFITLVTRETRQEKRKRLAQEAEKERIEVEEKAREFQLGMINTRAQTQEVMRVLEHDE